MTNLHTIFVRTQSCCLHFQYKVSPHVTSTSPQTSPPASPPVEDEKELLAPAQLVLPWGPNDFVCPCVEDMGVSKNCGTPKSYQIIHFNMVFHYKPSIWGGFPLFFGNTHMFEPTFISETNCCFLAQDWRKTLPKDG